MDSDISEIIVEKRKEWGIIEQEKKKALVWLRGDNRKVTELLFLDEQEKVNKLNKELMYILKSRQPSYWKDRYDYRDIEKAKEVIPIVDIISTVAWIRINNTYRLIRCPLHEDKTASMKIYEKTNSFYCQWCSRWWSWIDFIKYFNNVTQWEAIKIFLSFYKR